MLNDIEAALKARGLCKNRTAFCRTWLNRSQPYLTVMKGKASRDVLLTLWQKLQVAQQHDLAAITFGMIASSKPENTKHKTKPINI